MKAAFPVHAPPHRWKPGRANDSRACRHGPAAPSMLSDMKSFAFRHIRRRPFTAGELLRIDQSTPDSERSTPARSNPFRSEA